MVLGITYYDTFTGATHHTDDYFAFIYHKTMFGFCHAMLSFLSVVFVNFGIKPRSIGIFMSIFYVLVVGQGFSIFQDISVAAHVAGSKLPPWTNEWNAGKQTFDLFWNMLGAFYGGLFLYFTNSHPSICLGINYKVSSVKHMMTKWLSMFVHAVCIPLAAIVGALAVLHLPGLPNPENSRFKWDCLILTVYVGVLVLPVYWVIRIYCEAKHITAVAMLLDTNFSYNKKSEKDVPKMEGEKVTEVPMPKEAVKEIKTRIRAEMALLYIALIVWFVLEIFWMFDAFYLQTLISMTCSMIIFLLARVILAKSLRIQVYDDIIPAASYSTTGSEVVNLFETPAGKST